MESDFIKKVGNRMINDLGRKVLLDEDPVFLNDTCEEKKYGDLDEQTIEKYDEIKKETIK
jgi:hypothetical protein